MSDQAIPEATKPAATRPEFPRRAVVTGGMPYGSKGLHFGHIGGVFVQADSFARFLKDRIGAENVLFVSGTDCYGSPIVEAHRRQVAAGEFNGSLDDFVRFNHDRQKATFAAYHVAPTLFAASGFSPYREKHVEYSAWLLRTLHARGLVEQRTTPQFYDSERETFLNGRQVTGRCPVQGCRAEQAYADECSLGHQYEPRDLIDPVSTLSGLTPTMRDVTNWYLKLPACRELLKCWIEGLREAGTWRASTLSTLMEYFEPPTIHITRDQIESLDAMADALPAHDRQPGRSKSIQLIFEHLEALNQATSILAQHGIRYRTGKTLVPFRLTGNLEWGVPVPELDELTDLTFWVWPESLWVPITFVKCALEARGEAPEAWRDWWCSKESTVYQFIGEDNVFFYGLPQAAMFLGTQQGTPEIDPPEGELRLTHLVANRHLLFLDKKASSSGKVKPPMADDLLNFYTPDQLRAHFFSLALGKRAVGFRPKPLNPNATEKEPDPVLKEGNVLSNALNRAVRSCFYTTQKFLDGILPCGEVSATVLERAKEAILAFEAAMAIHDFPEAWLVAADYVRAINQLWTQRKPYDEACDDETRRQALVDAFHMVRTAIALLHPIAPDGTERVREYLDVGPELWCWDRIFEPLSAFTPTPAAHKLKWVEPRFDFFPKHPSQFKD